LPHVALEAQELKVANFQPPVVLENVKHLEVVFSGLQEIFAPFRERQGQEKGGNSP
jgi:hypothetical protein